MSRSLLRPDQLDTNGSYEFAQLTIDGYSGGDLDDGYLTGLLLTSGSPSGPGSTTLEIHADDGEINQVGTGNVTFAGNVFALQDVTITGDLTVNGTETILNVEQLVVEDPIQVLNSPGTEATADWTGISGRDADGYNRLGFVYNGGLTDGYWALTIGDDATADPDITPTRALAYIAEGDAYGDLSSTIDGNSGADKIGITPIAGLPGSTSVQDALEELSGGASQTGTNNDDFTINEDADAGTDEDACLILKGGDGTSLIEGYLCLITDSVNGDRMEFRLYESGSDIDRDLHLGPLGDTSDVNACVTFNSGNGTAANTAQICLDGDQDRLEYSATNHLFDGYVELNDNLAVNGTLDAYGDVNLGDSSADTVVFNAYVGSDILPTTDNTYDIGSPSLRWQDGYFVNLSVENLDADNLTFDSATVTDLEVTNCLIVSGNVCSDLIPVLDDQYDIGSPTNRWQDGYFENLDALTALITDLTSTTATITDLEVTGCLTVSGNICSDLIPIVNDAYDIGSPTNRFNDAYFTNLDVTNLTFDEATVDNLTVTDCLTVSGNICSDLIPAVNDAYNVGTSSLRWADGYFTYLDTSGDATIGDGYADCLTVNALICSDLLPEDLLHQLGNPTHRWLDGYFDMPTFTNITPVGDDDSLIGVLKGIDAALADTNVDHPRGVYEVTLAEAITDELDTTRTPDQGDTVDVGAGDITDAVFRDNIFIYRNGQLLYNDPSPAATTGAVVNDVARQTGSLSDLVFSGNLRFRAIVQIIDMR